MIDENGVQVAIRDGVRIALCIYRQRLVQCLLDELQRAADDLFRASPGAGVTRFTGSSYVESPECLLSDEGGGMACSRIWINRAPIQHQHRLVEAFAVLNGVEGAAR